MAFERSLHFYNLYQLQDLVDNFNFHNYDSLLHSESKKFDPRKRVGDTEKDQVVSLLFAAKSGDINSVRRYNSSEAIF